MRICLSRDNGYLTIEGKNAVKLCEEFGTPLFVVCERQLRKSYRCLREAFASRYQKVAIAYSYKANYLPAICSILNNEGAWAEVASSLELHIAKMVNVNPTKIIFNGPAKTDEELLEATRLGIQSINVDSLSELRRLIYITQKIGLTANVGVRLLPPFEKDLARTKFGIDMNSSQALEACEIIARSKNLRYIGLHAHLGTQLINVQPYKMMVKSMTDFASEIYHRLGLQTTFLNLGGGLPARGQIPLHLTKNSWPPPSLEEYASTICSTLNHEIAEKDIEPPILVLELGRALVSASTLLLMKVVSTKSTPKIGKWIIADAGLNLVPEAEYFQHKIIPVLLREGVEEVSIGGPLCMYEDFIGLRQRLPPVQEGDILAVLDAGAYSVSLSWQFIKTRARVCLLYGGKTEIIRGRENFEDILKLDTIPERLIKRI